MPLNRVFFYSAMRRLSGQLLPLGLIYSSILTTWGAPGEPIANPTGTPTIWIRHVRNAQTGRANKVGLGERIAVEIEGAPEALQRATTEWKKLVLLIDEVPLRGLCANAATITNSITVTNVTI